MDNDAERSILNRDIEDTLSETDIGDRPLNGKLPEKPFHLLPIEVKSDDFWIRSPPDSH